MKEIVLSQKKNGMIVLLLTVLGMFAALGGVIGGAILLEAGQSPVLFIIGMVWLFLG